MHKPLFVAPVSARRVGRRIGPVQSEKTLGAFTVPSYLQDTAARSQAQLDRISAVLRQCLTEYGRSLYADYDPKPIR